MANGILIVDKPAGWTSQDVAAKLRGLFSERRVGHGGTLDPMATGVLPVFLGRATRAVEFFESAEKEYVADVRFGLTTDTQDTTGTVLTRQPVRLDRPAVEAAMGRFLGPQEQVPPMYSAVKIGGKKLYELARAGKTVARSPRQITIHELELLAGEGADWRFRVRCSKGTYVRTLCADLGQALGCGGCMSALRRTRAGCFTLEQAVPLDALMAMEPEARKTLLLPVDRLFAAHPALTLTPRQAQAVRNGGRFTVHGPADGLWRFYGPGGEFLALGRIEQSVASSVKSFFEVN